MATGQGQLVVLVSTGGGGEYMQLGGAEMAMEG